MRKVQLGALQDIDDHLSHGLETGSKIFKGHAVLLEYDKDTDESEYLLWKNRNSHLRPVAPCLTSSSSLIDEFSLIGLAADFLFGIANQSRYRAMIRTDCLVLSTWRSLASSISGFADFFLAYQALQPDHDFDDVLTLIVNEELPNSQIFRFTPFSHPLLEGEVDGRGYFHTFFVSSDRVLSVFVHGSNCPVPLLNVAVMGEEEGVQAPEDADMGEAVGVVEAVMGEEGVQAPEAADMGEAVGAVEAVLGEEEGVQAADLGEAAGPFEAVMWEDEASDPFGYWGNYDTGSPSTGSSSEEIDYPDTPSSPSTGSSSEEIDFPDTPSSSE